MRVAMLSAFFRMEEAGSYADSGLFAGQVAEALITTAAGLAISAMAYLAHHFLHGRVRALVHDMEWAANDISQFLLREMPAGARPDEEDDEGDEPLVATSA